jgi:hypothetical protein
MTNANGRAFVLLAGGGMGAWIWQRLIPLLDYPAVAMDKRVDGEIRSASLGDCARYVARTMGEASVREAILVAHSGAGIIAPLVGGYTNAVKHIVFLSASIPVDGTSPQQGLPLVARLMNAVAVRMNTKPFPACRMEKVLRAQFCNACSEEVIEYVLAQEIRPEPPCVVRERVHRGGLSRVPGTYVKLLQDRTISLDAMERMTANYGGTDSIELEGDHMAMLGKPRGLAEALNGVARRTWGTPPA